MDYIETHTFPGEPNPVNDRPEIEKQRVTFL